MNNFITDKYLEQNILIFNDLHKNQNGRVFFHSAPQKFLLPFSQQRNKAQPWYLKNKNRDNYTFCSAKAYFKIATKKPLIPGGLIIVCR